MSEASSREDAFLDTCDLDGLVDERKLLRDKKTKALNNVPGDVEDLVVHVSVLETLKGRLEDIDQRILSLLASGEDKGDRERAKKERRDALVVQDDITAAIVRANRKVLQADAKAAQAASAPAGTSQAPAAPHPAHFPRKEPPKFHGDPLKYAEWWGLFRASVHEHPTMTVAEKFHDLIRSLRDDAALIVAGLRVTDSQADYEAVLKEIKDTYGDPYNLVPLFAQRMITAEKAKNTAENLRSLLATFRTSLREIEHASDQLAGAGACQHCRGKGDERLQLFVAPLLLSKLPPEMASRWKKTAASQFSVEELFEFLRKEINSLSVIDMTTRVEKQEKAPEKAPSKQREPYRRAACYTVQKGEGSDSTARQSPRVEDLPVEQRLDACRQRGMCINCLRRGHGDTVCRSTFRCMKCQGKHHTVLHDCFPGSSGGSGEPLSRPLNATVTLRTGAGRRSWMLSAAVDVYVPGSAPVRTRALIDSASQETYVTAALQHAVGAPVTKQERMAPEVFGGQQMEEQEYGRAKVEVKGRNGARVHLFAWIVPKICSKLVGCRLSASDMQPGMELADDPGEDLEVGLLLGSDCQAALFSEEKIVKQGGIVFLPTIFGYAVAGKLASPTVTALSLLLQASSMWELEALGIGGEEGDEATPQLVINRREDGRYECSLPWKGAARPALDQSQARARLRSYERLPPERKERYASYLREQHRDGILEESEDVISFLPHQGVWGSKLRVVLDGAAKSKRGLSINDTLEVGPNLVLPLVEVLLRFREPRNVLTCDVKAAFLQIAIDKPDQRYLGLLWMDGTQVKQSRYVRLPFGLCCSPWILQAVLHQHLTSGDYDEAVVGAIKRGLYVDDLHLGGDDLQALLHLARQAEAVLQGAKMELHKWRIGGLDVERGRAPRDSSPGPVLGINWNPGDDFLVFDLAVVFAKAIGTKRVLLSQLSQLYDPLGLLLPWSISLRLMFQSLWKREGVWDDPLPEEVKPHLETMKAEVLEDRFVRVPRWVGKPVRLEIFSDASPHAYSATIYASDGTRLHLILARVKLAPIKSKLTLPRLELMGVVLAVRLYRAFFGGMPVRFWTDSRIVLAWIKGDSTRWKTFVRNRVEELRDIKNCIRWIAGEENPADRATRGISLKALRESSLWWGGPASLVEDLAHAAELPEDVPLVLNDDEEQKTLLEARRTLLTLAEQTEPAGVPLERYGSLAKAMRMTAYARRVFSGTSWDRVQNPLTADELRDSLKSLLRQEQRKWFPEEVAQLKDGGSISKDSRLAKLRLTLEDGLLVGATRTGERFPILAPESILTTLLIRCAHTLVGHLGAPATTAEIQRQYWIPRLRNRVRHLLHSCVVCRRAHGRGFRVPEAQLPDFRRQPSRPFSRVGVDHCGPFFLDTGEKTWILLITCCVTRAVHLEVVRSLDTEATANALRRMQARRGPVEMVISDNGKSFVALQSALRGLKWRTVPEAAPAWNGFTERMVGTVKAVLKKVAQKCGYNWDDFVTLVNVVEEMVNRRPLTGTEDGVLSPMHFLLGCPPPPLLPAVLSAEVEDWTPGKRWKRLQATADQYWKEWVASYLPQLRAWHRPDKSSRPPQVGEVVLVEGPTPRNTWPLGRITQLIPGPDGQVRAVRLRIRGVETRRPVQRLVPLEVRGKDEDAEEEEVHEGEDAPAEMVEDDPAGEEETEPAGLVEANPPAGGDDLVTDRRGRVIQRPARYCP